MVSNCSASRCLQCPADCATPVWLKPLVTQAVCPPSALPPAAPRRAFRGSLQRWRPTTRKTQHHGTTITSYHSMRRRLYSAYPSEDPRPLVGNRLACHTTPHHTRHQLIHHHRSVAGSSETIGALVEIWQTTTRIAPTATRTKTINPPEHFLRENTSKMIHH